jgi:chromosome segregation ATPase
LRAADTNTVSARLSSVLRVADLRSRADRLSACDESLSLIAADVEQLTKELDRVRAGASPLVQSLAERDTLLTEKELELTRLENERLQALRGAEDATAALRETRELFDEHANSIATSTRGLEELRTRLAERDRQLEEAERERSRLDKALEEERAAVADLRVRAKSTVDAVDDRAAARGHVLFAPFPEGYRLVVSDKPCPRPGEVVDAEGHSFVVARVGRSPFPADDRSCAFLQLRITAI